MYNQNGTFYTEEHSISFGILSYKVESGSTYEVFDRIANTWTDWHLIPSSRPAVVNPSVVTKFVEIPGSNGMLDLTDYLTGAPVYGQRQGSFSFHVDNDHEKWEDLRKKIANSIHGRDVCMVLEDDPSYFYKGRFTVGNWESGQTNSSISLAYQLEPFKYRVNMGGSVPVIWDTFNFNTDYDYYTSLGDNITVNNSTKSVRIYLSESEYSITPIVSLISSGSVTVSFGGVSKLLQNGYDYNYSYLYNNITAELGTAIYDFNIKGSQYKTLTIKGTGSVEVKWRGGSL